MENAAKYFAQAAELRDARAMLYLGEMYSKGEGVKLNKETAYMWLWLAANSNVPNASKEELQLRGELSNSAVIKARKKAIEWADRHQGTVLVLSGRNAGH